MAAGEQTVRIEGRRLRITNLDKVLYPDTGTTKGEVIAYYTRIAPVLIPHVTGRPVTRKRWPDGVGTADDPGMSFFAKDLEAGAPSWVQRRPIPHSSGPKDYPLVGDVPTLVYLAQVASLELHVPQWRFAPDGERGNPDRLVLDLDPGPGVGLAECAEVARQARAILSDMGMEPYPVTSGSKGIHLYAPLPGEQSSDAITAFAKELARAIEADSPDLVVSQMAKSARPGKVFIDWSQNNGAKTTIAPFSLRGRAHPTVAAPRTWEELDDPELRHLLFSEVLERVEASGDPMAALGFTAGARATEDGPLGQYIAKRTAGATPEPVPANPAGAAASEGLPRFVIQEHHATRLHWDLRLERDGVLASWAVPKGVPSTTARNNLAVQTEDHPMEYATFAGTIPAGQYGAGSMTIWDEGRYELEKWRDDEVIFTLEGRPGGPLGRVRLALIRTDGSGEKSTWLLHRMKTDAAGHPQADGAPVVPTDADDAAPAPDHHAPAPAAEEDADPSAVDADDAGPSLSDPADAALSGPAHAGARIPPRAELRPMLATTATPGIARQAARRWSGEDDAWVEAKWDGIRAIGVWDGQRLHLRARSGNDVTAKYPELTTVDLGLGPEPAVLDGEIVALDGQGRPSFPLLQTRMNLEKPREIARETPRTPVKLFLFDVLALGGRDLAPRPLRERRRALEKLATAASGPLVLPPVFDDVDAALAASRSLGLEGIVVKDPASPYRRGERTEQWLKVKLTRTQEVVIGGVRPGKGGRSGTIGSLLLGVPGDDGLHYAGRVGSGFSEATLAQLEARLTPLRTDENPFVDVPRPDASDALWVRPDLVGEVEFAEFTPGGILRHARWRGLRPDKTPDEVVRES
ncbi:MULTISPECIES: ATP-dependent DNA ligase [Microbacterium]|uniref:DNA ligase (ATP) n=1 Tax=Microbacterium wangchenii TaxID=2541726 RepID=A0ABX5SSR3_9MICO|nr:MULTISPECIES: ATP-dependent DNA ligase [Microbacterium]MCK6067901.1 ATP-dependent DNA ligase [Microbacterium sp. EYE_512]QBR89208.1 ATP-dependent DNA ligase [Microbacterium wangchenii]TXK10880.1 ATP-dependent DNA ligase [Microbacterium wangchenii]